MFAVPLGPEIADRLALESEVDDEGDAVCGQRSDYCPADVRESSGDFFREDAEV